MVKAATTHGGGISYLDYNATTPLLPEVASAVADCLAALKLFEKITDAASMNIVFDGRVLQSRFPTRSCGCQQTCGVSQQHSLQ